MFVWWLHGMILRSPEDGGAGGGAPPAGGEGGGAGDPPPVEGQNGDGGAGDPPPNEGQAAPGEVYRPEGLAEHLLGTTDQETIDRMAAALNGYRKRDGERGVPEAVLRSGASEILRPVAGR